MGERDGGGGDAGGLDAEDGAREPRGLEAVSGRELELIVGEPPFRSHQDDKTREFPMLRQENRKRRGRLIGGKKDGEAEAG